MPNNPRLRTVIVYRTTSGREPFTDWLNELCDATARRRILQRLLRLEQGNFGDSKALGAGISELRFFFGPGYRVYFGEAGDTVVVLLSGGDKDGQSRDIEQTQTYWKDYTNRE